MKRSTLHYAAALAALVALASGLAFAQFERGDYTQKTLGEIAQPAAPAMNDGATYGVASFPLYPPKLEPGPGRDEVSAYCSTCHSTRYITMQSPLPKDVWDAEVTKMVKVMGASLPEGVQPRILNYLDSHYTPETRRY